MNEPLHPPAWYEGFDARCRGIGADRNPYYPVNEQEDEREWQLGWAAADKDTR
jgi:hypothetical protein